jgi:hypothetical protein
MTAMQDFHFQIVRTNEEAKAIRAGYGTEAAHQVVWRGYSPADAILRFYGTCLPDARIASPVLCGEDGVIYHCHTEGDHRWIQIVSPAVQFQHESLAELPVI